MGSLVKTMRLRLIPLFVIAAMTGGACGESPGFDPSVGAFKVTLTKASTTDPGTAEAPRAFSSSAESYIVDIVALRHDVVGQVQDTGYNGHVVLKVVPTGKLDQDPFVVEVKNGQATGVKVGVRMAFGTVRLVAADLGYKPAKVLADAACLNGKDDDGDGFIDDEDKGCLIGGDDSEEGGNGATGASAPLYYANPRLYDIQKPIPGESLGDESAMDGMRVTVDRGWLLITNLSSDGLYVTDYEGAKWDAAAGTWKIAAQDLSYDHMFAFNFNVPLNLQVGDCLVELDGKVEEFYGYTEMGFPSWKKGDNKFCFAKARAAGLTSCPTDGDSSSVAGKACRAAIEALASTPVDISKPIDYTDPNTGTTTKVWPFKDKLFAERFEAGLVQVSSVTLFSKAKKCDRNGNGNIDFNDPNDPLELEEKCANGCGDDETCIVYEQYKEYNQWSVNMSATVDSVDYVQEVSAISAGAIPNWNAMTGCDFSASTDGLSCTRTKAKTLSKVLGTLRTFQFGRPPWILQTRSPADCPDCDNSK